jgi:rod shape-determining protein MreC
MSWIFHFVLRFKTFFSLLFVLTLSLRMMSLSLPRKLELANLFTTTIFYPVQFMVHHVKKVRNIWYENITLRQNLANLSLENAALNEKTSENLRLRELLRFKERSQYTLIPSEVIARNPERGVYTMILNVGNSDSVDKGMAVVSINGVVGKIVTASSFASHVQLITDPNCRISALIQRSRVSGILECEDGIHLKMRVQEYADVQPGDRVITSGFGGVFPKGLKIGEVRKIERDEHDIYKELQVNSSVDYDYVEEVFVLKRQAQWVGDTTFTEKEP